MITRRDALGVVGVLAGYVNGIPVNQGQVMFLALDAVEVIDLRYRGRRVLINPHDLMDALGAPPMFNPAQQAPIPRAR